MTERHMSNRERALALVRARGIARARDFSAAGIPLAYLKRMTETGELVRLGRGLYQDPEGVGEDIAHNLAEAARLDGGLTVRRITSRHREFVGSPPEPANRLQAPA